MRVFNSEDEFGFLNIMLRWLTALLIAAPFILKLWRAGLEYYHSWHFEAFRFYMAPGTAVALLVFSVRVKAFQPREKMKSM